MSFSEDAKNAFDRMEQIMEDYAAARVREALKFKACEFAEEFTYKARAEGYKAGQEDMRERAVMLAGSEWGYFRLAEEIRSLSIEEKSC